MDVPHPIPDTRAAAFATERAPALPLASPADHPIAAIVASAAARRRAQA